MVFKFSSEDFVIFLVLPHTLNFLVVCLKIPERLRQAADHIFSRGSTGDPLLTME